MNKWQSIAFLDDNQNVKSSTGIEIIDESTSISKYIDDYEFFVGIGNNAIREKIQRQLEAEGASIPVLVHPSAIIGEQVYLEAGTIVMAGTLSLTVVPKLEKGALLIPRLQ